MRPIETRYARSGDVRIAYQVVGQGSFDLVFVPGYISNLDLHWEDEGYSRLLKRLSAFSRLILFDKRGTGLSDRVDSRHLPSLETRMDDVRAVMDAAGSGRAALLGASEGAPMAMLFAATYPERTRALVLYGGDAARASGSLHRNGRDLVGYWRNLAEFRARARGRCAFYPMVGTVRAAVGQPDCRSYTRPHECRDRRAWHPPDDPRIDAADPSPQRRARRPGGQPLPRQEDSGRQARRDTRARSSGVADLVEEFLTGQPAVADTERVLSALLATRIYDTAGLGDRMWSERSQRFHVTWRLLVGRYGGRVAGTHGEMMMARFDGPARAIRCAAALREAAQQIGVASAQGAHVGEIELRGQPTGLTARVTMQLASHAGRGDIIASRLVAELAVGSGLHFVDAGRVSLDELGEPLPVVQATSEQHLEPACRPKTHPLEPATLTARESEVVSLIADGKSNAAIAAELKLSEHTVKRHVANILLKLDLPSRAAAAAFSARHTGPDGP